MGPKSRTVKFYSTVSDRSEIVHLISRLFNSDGGPGSGNFGHKGRPGLVGGSGAGGGTKGASGGQESSSSVFGIKAEPEKKPAKRIKIDPENENMVIVPINRKETAASEMSVAGRIRKAALNKLREEEAQMKEGIKNFGEKKAYVNALNSIQKKIKELEEEGESPETIENRLIDKEEECDDLAEKMKKVEESYNKKFEDLQNAHKNGDADKAGKLMEECVDLAKEKASIVNKIRQGEKEIEGLKKRLKNAINKETHSEPEPEDVDENSILSLENKREELTRRGNELRHLMRSLSKEENELYSRRNDDLSDEERKEIVKRIDEVSEEKNAIRKEHQSIENEINDLDSKISGLERSEPLESVEDRIEHKEKKHDELLDEEDDLYHKMQSVGAALEEAKNAHDHKAVKELEEEYERAKDLWYDAKDIRAENDLQIARLKEIRRTKIGQREREEIERLGTTEAEYRREKALEHFGTTDDWHEAGWILPDGQMLNFSGEKDYHPGERGLDHREIGQIYPEFGSYNTQGMQRFRSDGNVRFYPESPGVNVGTKEPTQEQYDEIARIALDAIDETGFFIVDFSTKDNSMFGSLRYAVNPSDAGIDGVQAFDDPYEVINDIRHYFETGEITEEFGSPHFWGDAMPEQLAEDGGPGSGNHGHEGRPGKVGGSGPGGGTAKNERSTTKKAPRTIQEYREASLARKKASKVPRKPDENDNYVENLSKKDRDRMEGLIKNANIICIGKINANSVEESLIEKIKKTNSPFFSDNVSAFSAYLKEKARLLNADVFGEANRYFSDYGIDEEDEYYGFGDSASGHYFASALKRIAKMADETFPNNDIKLEKDGEKIENWFLQNDHVPSDLKGDYLLLKSVALGYPYDKKETSLLSSDFDYKVSKLSKQVSDFTKGTNFSQNKERRLEAYNNAKSSEEVFNAMLDGGIFTPRPASRIDADRVSLDGARLVAEGYEKFLDRFPFLAGNLKGISDDETGNRDAYAACDIHWGGRVDLNASGLYFGAPSFEYFKRAYETDVKEKYHPEGTTYKSVITHELSHALDGYLSDRGIMGSQHGSPARMFSGKLQKSVLKSLGLTKDNLKEEVSDYANKDSMEWFAECISEALDSPSPRRMASECLRQLEEALEKEGVVLDW